MFFDIPTDKQMAYIENAIHKISKFRNALKGIIIGQFTHGGYFGLPKFVRHQQTNDELGNHRLQDQMQLLVPGFLF